MQYNTLSLYINVVITEQINLAKLYRQNQTILYNWFGGLHG